jgi:hypothetical protein
MVSAYQGIKNSQAKSQDMENKFYNFYNTLQHFTAFYTLWVVRCEITFLNPFVLVGCPLKKDGSKSHNFILLRII